ncbi:WD40-repeat-containing domain protein [Trametes elegans]|nr:WD40-repeat-containing domain protein [Trametes elegans]
MVMFVKHSPDSRYLMSGSADSTCRIWDVASGALHKELQGHGGIVCGGALDAESRRIVSCADDASAQIWDVETGEMLVRTHEHHGPVGRARVLTSSNDSALTICDSDSGERCFALTGHEGVVSTSRLSRDEWYVVSASEDTTVRLRWTEDGPIGETLASGADDGTIRVRLRVEWDPNRAENDKEEERTKKKSKEKTVKRTRKKLRTTSSRKC